MLFLPPSDAYVRSFFYLLYTLIKLYYTKALSDQASSLAPDWILLLWGPRIPESLRDSTTTFQWLSCWVLVNSLDPTDCSPPGFSVHGIFQARVLEWDAITFSNLGSLLKGCCWPTSGFLASGGEEFNLGPETRLDCSELLCNKVLLKYKGDRESFWHRHQKGAERVPPC